MLHFVSSIRVPCYSWSRLVVVNIWVDLWCLQVPLFLSHHYCNIPHPLMNGVYDAQTRRLNQDGAAINQQLRSHFHVSENTSGFSRAKESIIIKSWMHLYDFGSQEVFKEKFSRTVTANDIPGQYKIMLLWLQSCGERDMSVFALQLIDTIHPT